MWKKFILAVLVGSLLCSLLCFNVSAREYSSDYPNIYNSGSPLWIHCWIVDHGEFVIILDPDTNLQAFGFDAPTGYNLINNTGSQIRGKAYHVNTDSGMLCYWGSYDQLYLRTGSNTYVPVQISYIYGTTMDFVDYYNDRGNDAFKYDIDKPEYIIAVCSVAVVGLLVISLFFKPKLLRM